jgi:hypothetical protein
MGVLDRELWQWSIRRPGTIEWRILGHSLTETEAREWALRNGYEIRREAPVDTSVEKAPAPTRRASGDAIPSKGRDTGD